MLDFDFAIRSWLQAFQFFFIENHERSRLDFKALLDLFVGYFLAAVGVNHVLLDAGLRPFLENMKAHGLILQGRVQFYRDLRRVNCQLAFPNRPRCHFLPRAFSRRAGATGTECFY